MFAAPDVAALVTKLRRIQAEMIDAVAAGEGLQRIAEFAAAAAGAPVLIVLPRLGWALAPTDARPAEVRDALRRCVAERIRGRPGIVPVDVVGERPIRLAGAVVGVVALLAGSVPPNPDAHDVLYVTAMCTLVQLTVTDAREETEERVRASLLEDLRAGNAGGGAEIARRTARLGCDVSAGARLLCAEPLVDRPRLIETIILRHCPDALAQRLEPSCEGGTARIYALLPSAGAGDPRQSAASCQRLVDQLTPHAKVGLSGVRSDAGQLGEAIQEAELMLDAIQEWGAPAAGIVGEGVYKLLFRMLASHPEELRAFHEMSIAPLARHDDQYRTGLIETLEAYLHSNCNMNVTAAAIFAHRHTVAYRLRKVQELTGLDPTVAEDRERLGLGLKVHRLVSPRPAGVPAGA